MPRHPNPFAQSPVYWKVTFVLHADAAGTAEESFDDIALAVSGFETDEAAKLWTFELLFADTPDMTEIRRRLLVLSMLHEIAMPQADLQRIEQQDWLAQVARSFPPLSIGRFFVHGSHSEETPPTGALTIQVDAGAAFGSGEHGTTSRCLMAMEWLARRHSASSILDMGCGSGILAIAAAKLWRAPVLAADIDEVAVRVTQENVRINRVQHQVDCVVSDGYANERIRRRAPYDLIVANILARPLMSLAPDLARNLAPNGVAILSGLLASQEAMVMQAHRLQGLTLRKRFLGQEWCTLVVSRR